MKMKQFIRSTRSLLAVGAMVVTAAAGARAQYRVVELNVPGASATTATGINNDNVVVGMYGDAAGTHTFTYNPKTHVYTYPIEDPKAPDQTYSTSINTSGTITGYYWTPPGSYVGMVDQNGTFSDFNVSGCFNNVVSGINDGVETAGYCEYRASDNTLHYEGWANFFSPVVFQCSGAIDTSVFAVNNNGATVGTYDSNSMGPIHGFLGGYGCSQTIDYSGAFITALTGINDNTTILGYWSGFDGPSAAFLYNNGTFTDITIPKAKKGVLTGKINNNNWFVGNYFDREGVEHAFYAKPAR
jgi:hypothetical protein